MMGGCSSECIRTQQVLEGVSGQIVYICLFTKFRSEVFK